MAERLERTELQKITLHNSDVHWYKEGKEIVVNAELFDVHRYSVKKDSTVFTGLFDIRETELKKQVKELIEKKDQKSSERNMVIAKLLLQVWVTDSKKEYEFLQEDLTGIRSFIDSYSLSSVYISIPFPPPKV
ncbi:MAG: hypothetical protein H7122_11860 [Chitinophagaceae bacterium]|nr:hypothetical protein [Chitinophagaceae bacterium]